MRFRKYFAGGRALGRVPAFVLALVVAAVAVPLTGLGSAAALAQAAFPVRPVHLIVPFPPGGASDAMMRALGTRLEKVWAQPVIVDNKPGAGTVVGTSSIARAPADGHTVGLVTTSLAINAAGRRDLPYDATKDLVPVTQLAIVHQAIFARADSPLNSAKDLVDASKASPGRITYGTAGVGTAGHMFVEQVNASLGTSMMHVAYKGSSPARVDLVGGQIDLMVDALSAHYELVKAGRLKVIALISPQRHPVFTQLPTFAEQFPGASVESFFGLAAPAGTPRALVERLNGDFVAALKDPVVDRNLQDLGLVAVGSTAQQFDTLLRGEIRRWSDLFGRVQLKID